MLIEKEVIRPGTYFYTDEKSGLPAKLVVTPEWTKYWHEQGKKMIALGLPIPVPYEHDFGMHPMTPKDKLLNNAGEVKDYRLKGDRLWSVVDVQDPEVKRKMGHSIRWTSPWINSFTDGQGKEWKNVISHLALTTRPRIVKQEPFTSVAAAMSIAREIVLPVNGGDAVQAGAGGFCLSRAGRLFKGKKTNRLRPRYPIAFSMWAGGVKLADDDMPAPKKKKPDDSMDADADPSMDAGADDFGGDLPDEEKTPDLTDADNSGISDDLEQGGMANPLADSNSDVKMEELLCDLLQALGVPMPDQSNETEFKRHLYEAAMSKIKELTSKGMAAPDQTPDQNQPPSQQPNASQPNPIIQQEQQPMYMSLEDINKLPDPMKGVALAMYAENQKLRTEMEANKKTVDSLRDAKLKEAATQRASRVALLSKLSPRVKADLDTMLALPAMALSMGEGGAVLDPMASTLAVLEKGLSDLPRLLTIDQSALSVQAQPTDAEMMSEERQNQIADGLAQKMGCPPEKKAS